MKKRIAIFACGWSNECLMVLNRVFVDYAERHNTDLFFFINYSAVGGEHNEDMRELNIYRLPKMSSFDGAIILGNTFHIGDEFETILEAIREADLPAVCLGYKIEGVSCFECNNYDGMYELAEHLVTSHGVKDVLYVGGPVDNQESLLRAQALKDVLDKYGYVLKEENVLCGNWNYFDTQYAISEWYDNHHGILPDAIVCANDVMAMGTYVGLAKSGVQNLKNIIVTGFDNLPSGNVFSPAITSVDPGWEDMASEAMEHLLKCMENGNEIVNKVIRSHMSIKESCGCLQTQNVGLQEGNEIFLGYERMVGASYLGGHMCELSVALSEVRSKEEVGKFFEYILQHDHVYEGDEFYFCLVEDFFDSIENGEILTNKGYPSKMELVGGIKDNEIVKPETFETELLLPSYDPEKETVDQYMFITLSSRKESYGYAVMVNNLRILYDYSFFVWSFNMGQNIERMRQNFRLEEMNQRLAVLSVTDALTGVYNRMGCEKIAFPLLEHCYHDGKRAVMLFMDINKMKVINDSFGHDQGDVAIRLTAAAIQQAIPNDWVVVRYGGDEFLVAGECSGENTAEEIAERIQYMLAQSVKVRKLPYPITVGIGMVYVNPEEELDLSRCLRVADAKMYAMKKERERSER